MLTVISVCGVIMVVCHDMIPDENLVWQPEVLLAHVTSELHYVPSEWKGQVGIISSCSSSEISSSKQ